MGAATLCKDVWCSSARAPIVCNSVLVRSWAHVREGCTRVFSVVCACARVRVVGGRRWSHT